jgi:hypothetical protein
MRLRARTTIGSRGGLEMSKKKQEKKTQKKRITFKLVDGQWQNDPGNDQMVHNSFGTVNNILNV